MMQCVFEAYGKNGFFHLEKYNAAFNLTLMRTVTQQQKKGQNIWHNILLKQKGNTIFSKCRSSVGLIQTSIDNVIISYDILEFNQKEK